MSGGSGYLTAVYRDGRVYIGSKSYAAGIFAAHLLNRYYLSLIHISEPTRPY